MGTSGATHLYVVHSNVFGNFQVPMKWATSLYIPCKELMAILCSGRDVCYVCVCVCLRRGEERDTRLIDKKRNSQEDVYYKGD